MTKFRLTRVVPSLSTGGSTYSGRSNNSCSCSESASDSSSRWLGAACEHEKLNEIKNKIVINWKSVMSAETFNDDWSRQFHSKAFSPWKLVFKLFSNKISLNVENWNKLIFNTSNRWSLMSFPAFSVLMHLLPFSQFFTPENTSPAIQSRRKFVLFYSLAYLMPN